MLSSLPLALSSPSSSTPYSGSIAAKTYRKIACAISGSSLLWIPSYCTRPRI